MMMYFSECLSAIGRKNLTFYLNLMKILILSDFLAQAGIELLAIPNPAKPVLAKRKSRFIGEMKIED